MAQKRYQCVQDLQGETYQVGTSRTAQEWKDWALKQREESEDTYNYKLIESTPLDKVVEEIGKLYGLVIVEAPLIFLDQLVETMSSYHFRLQVVKDNKVVKDEMYPNIPSKERNSYNNYVVTGVKASVEVSKESPITHSIDVRPVILVMVEEGNENE